MFDVPLLKACVEQRRVLEELIKPPRIVLDRDSLAEAVLLYALYSEQLDPYPRCLLLKTGKVDHPETPAIGDLISSLIKATLARGYLLKRAVGLAGRVNHVPVPSSDPNTLSYELKGPAIKVDGAEHLDEAIRRLEKLLEVHSRDWPWTQTPTQDEALAAHRNGESETLADAFASISNLDAAAWGRQVEEFRLKKQIQAGG